MLCVELTVERPSFVAAMIAEEHPGAGVHVEESCTGARRVYAALPAVGSHGAASTVMLARRLAARLKPYGLVGASSFHAGPGMIGEATREAELVLDIVRHPGPPIVEEIGNGTYKLLLRLHATQPEELRSFYEETVAPMVTYDEQHRTELVATLREYLTADCNMNVTAAAVFAHRHTIASRLERIRELTGLDPMRYEDREQLGLGLKVHRLLAPHLAVYGPVC
jgi:sugar diacid utilization regulator